MARATIDELAEALNAANPVLTSDERDLALAVYHALVQGGAVAGDELARRTGKTQGWIESTLERWSGVFRDDEGRIVAFWGLSLDGMPHRLELDGKAFGTWCAFDPLFLAPLLQTTARVTSTCPVTGTEVTLLVGPDGVGDLHPPGAVLSFLRPSEAWGDDIIERFCHYILLFASEDAARKWTNGHPGTFVLSVDDAFELGKRTLGRLAGQKQAG